MKADIKILGVLGILNLAILSWSAVNVFAQKGTADSTVITKHQLKEQREDIKSNSQASRQEEKDLRERIRQAELAGDKETARSLREQLRTMHRENVEQKQQDIQGLKDARQGWIADKKEARQQRMDANGDGVVNETERNQFWKKKLDANQDGKVDKVERERLRDRKHKFDKDNNPPGPMGGEGTNWENPPGPQGGPGASPDRKFRGQGD
jgi:hypothetical protein